MEGASLTALTEIQGQLNSAILKSVAERQKAIAVEGQYNKIAQAQLRITQLRQQGFDALSGEEVKSAGRSLFGTEFEKSFVSAGAKAKVVADVISGLEAEIKGATKTAGELGQQFDTTFGIGEKASKRSIDATVNQRTALEAAKDALEDMTPAQRAALEFSKRWDERWESMKKRGGGSFSGATDSAKLYAKALASIEAVAQKGDVLGADVISEQAKEIENQIERLLEAGFKPYSKEIENLRGMLKGLREDAAKGFSLPNQTQQTLGVSVDSPTLPSLSIPEQVVSIDTTSAQDSLKALRETALKGIDTASEYKTQWEQIGGLMSGLKDNTTSFSETINQAILLLTQNGKGLQATFLAMADAMGNAFATAEGGFKEMALAAVSAGAKIIKVTIQQGVARAVASALQSVPFPLNLALGAVAGGLAAGLFSRAISSIGVPGLAKGGVIDEPTFALIGEYPGAKSNPEIVTPENKMRDVFSDVLRSFSFNGNPASIAAPQAMSVNPGDGFLARLIERQQALDVQPVTVDVNVTGQIGHDAIYLSNQKEADRRRRFG